MNRRNPGTMRSRPRFLNLTLATAVAAGCSGAEGGGELARVRTDTLTGGVIRLMSEGPTAWPASEPATLMEEHRFQGEDGTPSELGEPRYLAVDAWGRVYLVDGKPASIKVFDREGTYLRTIGREGEGPGEFRVGFIAIKGEYLVLQDPQVARLSVFDTAGKFLRSWSSSCCYWSDIQIDEQNRIYVPSMSGARPGDPPRGTPYVRWSFEGVALDTVWVPYQQPGKVWTVSAGTGGTRMSMMTPVPFMAGMVSALHPAGGIVYGWTGRYEIVHSMSGRDSVRVFGRDWTPDPVTAERRTAELESRIKRVGSRIDQTVIRNAFRLEDIPSTLPAYESLRVDPAGRVWARRLAVSDTSRSSFDLFDPNAMYLGPVVAPVRLPTWGPQWWTREGVVAVVEDEEGRPTVVRLRLVIGRKP